MPETDLSYLSALHYTAAALLALTAGFAAGSGSWRMEVKRFILGAFFLVTVCGVQGARNSSLSL
jgi:hypothetical protein